MDKKERPLSPLADIFVRYLLGSEENKDLLIDFINAVLEQKGYGIVMEIELLTPFNLAALQNSKESILDVKAKDSEGRWVNVEVQIDDKGDHANRSLYYWAKSYSGQLKKGDIYKDLAPSICINLLDFNLFPELPGYHSCFQITEVDDPEYVLSKHLQIHFIELPKNELTINKATKNKLDAWCFFFENEGSLEEQDMTVLLKENPAIKKAHETYQSFTQNEKLMDMAQAREKWKRDIDSQLHGAEMRGLEKGLEEGHKEDARKMRNRGFSIEDIADITGLSQDEIRKL